MIWGRGPTQNASESPTARYLLTNHVRHTVRYLYLACSVCSGCSEALFSKRRDNAVNCT